MSLPKITENEKRIEMDFEKIDTQESIRALECIFEEAIQKFGPVLAVVNSSNNFRADIRVSDFSDIPAAVSVLREALKKHGSLHILFEVEKRKGAPNLRRFT